MSLRMLLDDKIEKLFEINPELKNTNKNEFEVACASFTNVKHLYGLEFDDLTDGIMGNGGDEGIDLCYIFCNGILVKDEAHPINKESHIKVKFFQVKKESGFSTNGFKNIKEGIEEIFDLELNLEKLKKIGANQDIIEMADLIRRIFRKSRRESANFTCEVYYITIAIEEKPSDKIIHLEESLRKHSLNIPFEFKYYGVQKLLDLTEMKDETLEIKFNSQPLEIKQRNVELSGYSGFVVGNDLMKSLVDEENIFKSHLTEGNVRFFLGEDTKINNSIIETAKDTVKSDNFWAMNNGLTIIGDRIEPLGNNEYCIINPQIVNGCQTVHCLYIAYNELSELKETLKVFVKIVKSDKLEVQTDIISATNSQNQVKYVSLKANDNIQRNIEKYLKSEEIYYERRENYYKRKGLTGSRVIGMLKMAQIVHAIVNKESIIAINDPTTLFETSNKYNSIFNDSADFDIYKYSAMLYQKVWSLKNSDMRTNNYNSEEKSIISKSGLVFLHIMSSLMLSKIKIKDNKVDKTEILTLKLDISLPSRKNSFVKRKEQLLIDLHNDIYLGRVYSDAKELLFSAISKYSSNGKTPMSFLKNRSFDKDYLIPVINRHLTNKEQLGQTEFKFD